MYTCAVHAFAVDFGTRVLWTGSPGDRNMIQDQKRVVTGSIEVQHCLDAAIRASRENVVSLSCVSCWKMVRDAPR